MVKEITVRELQSKLNSGDCIHLLDVRQPWERDIATLPDSQLVPLPELPARVAEVKSMAGSLLVVFCHHGIRSLTAAHFLEQAGFAKVYSLAGGIDAWSSEIDPSLPRYKYRC